MTLLYTFQAGLRRREYTNNDIEQTYLLVPSNEFSFAARAGSACLRMA